jgi:hypothetical protein
MDVAKTQIPTLTTTKQARIHQVDRMENSLIHSERRTPKKDKWGVRRVFVATGVDWSAAGWSESDAGTESAAVGSSAAATAPDGVTAEASTAADVAVSVSETSGVTEVGLGDAVSEPVGAVCG